MTDVQAPPVGRGGRIGDSPVRPDGTLDESEKEAMKKAREEHRAELLKRFDTDGDGNLSDTERAALRKEMREQHGKRGRHGRDGQTDHSC